MEDKIFLDDYFKNSIDCLNNEKVKEQLIQFKEIITSTKGKLIFVGNGASASIAGHCALDYTKQGKIESMCFSDSALLTAFGNDYGYEYWVEKALDFYAKEDDVVILISSSGKSPNIINGAEYCKNNGIKFVTFSGFEETNPLKQLGDLNFWVDSKSYNIIECTHMFWLMSMCDLLIGKKEYSVK